MQVLDTLFGPPVVVAPPKPPAPPRPGKPVQLELTAFGALEADDEPLLPTATPSIFAGTTFSVSCPCCGWRLESPHSDDRPDACPGCTRTALVFRTHRYG